MKPIVLLLLSAACAHVALDAESARRSLLQADVDFAREVAMRGTEAWVDAFAEDGAMFVADEPIIRGHQQIRAAMESLGDPRRAPTQLQIRWKPLGAEVSRDGSLGWTSGNALVVSPRGESKVKYVTVWRREGDSWKAVADIGNAGEATPGAGP